MVRFRVERVFQDLKFALRQLRKNPGFALTAILILALGIGASVAIFAFVDAALIQPLPYASPDRLMDVAENSAMFPRSNLSRDDFDDWQRLNHSFASLSAYGGTGYLLQTPTGPVPVPAGRVSDGFFRALGVQPMLGRDFQPGEDRPGEAKVPMLSYGTWQGRYGGRRDVVGQTVNLSGDTYTIIGVLPREFSFAPRATAEFWVPLREKNGCEQRRSCHNLDGVGRLNDGVTRQAALAEMKAIAAQLETQYPESNQGQERERVAAFGADSGQGAAHPAYAAGRCRAAAVDRLRQCGEPDAGACGKPPARDRGARCAGRNPRSGWRGSLLPKGCCSRPRDRCRTIAAVCRMVVISGSFQRHGDRNAVSARS